MKEEKQGGGLDLTVLPQKAEHFALPDSKPVMPARLDGKRKPKAKKTDFSSEDNCFIGQSICGVVDGLFDAGYMLTVRVGDTDTILRGIVFEPGLSVPISEANDIAPNVKVIKRDESILFPEAPNTSNSMPVRQHSHVPILPCPVPHAIQMPSSRTQKQIGSGPTDMECCQLDSSPFKCTSISEAVSRLPSSMPASNAQATSSVGVQNQMEPPERIYGQKDMVSHQAIAVPLTTTFTSQGATRFPSTIPVPDALRMTSLHVQNQVGVPGQTEMVSPRLDAIPSKSSSISQSQSVPMLCFPIPVSNTPGTSSVHVQNQRYPYATVGSGKTDAVPPQPDGVPSKSTPISEAVSTLPSPVPLQSTLATSSVHVQDQIRHPYATVGSGKTDTVPPQPDAVPSKSTSISEAASRLPSPVTLPNALATSSVHVQNQMRYPYAKVVSGKTDVPHQLDGVPSNSTSISEAVSRLPSSVPLPNALATSPVHVKMEAGPSFITGSTRTDMVPQLDANPSKSTFISQTLQLLPSSMPASNNVLANSIVHVHNEMGPPATDCSGQKVTMHLPNALGMSSVHLQNQTGPLMTGSGQIDMVDPMSDANPLKSTSISQTSTVHVQNEMEPPATFGSAQNDMLSVPDALGMSSVHLQKQTGLPLALKIASSQIDTLLLQPDSISSKSTSILQAVTISPSSMAAPNTLAISSAHVQTPLGPPATIGSGQKDMMPQQDAMQHKSTSIVQTVPIVSSAVPVPNAPASQSFFIQNIEPPVRIGSGQTDLMPSQPEVMPPNSTSISPTVPMFSVPVPVPNAPVPNAPSSASVFIKNQVEPPVKVESRDTDSVPSQPAAISPKSTSILQSPVNMPVPNAPNAPSSSSNFLQNLMGPPVTIEPGQTDMVATQPEEIQCMFPSISQSFPMLQASIPITFTAVTSSEPSTNSESEPDSHPPGHGFHSTEATETRMDVDGGA